MEKKEKGKAPLSAEKTRETEIPLVVESVIGPEIPAPVEKLKATEGPAKVEEVTETIPPRQHKDRAPLLETAPPVDEMNKATPPPAKIKDEQRTGTYQGTRVFLRSLVRLASVIISCLALIFSIKAFRLAQRCYQEMTRFQMKFQDQPEKEDPLENE